MSIRLRLTLWYTAILILVLAGFALLVYVVVGQQLTRQLNYDVRVQALQASRTLRAVSGGYQYRIVTPLDLPAALPQLDDGLYAQVVGPRGDVLATSRGMTEPLPIPPETLREALAGREIHDTLTVGDERLEMYSAPLLLNGVAVGVLQVAVPRAPMEASQWRLGLILGGVVVGTATLAAGLGWLLATLAMRPVDRLTRTAKAIGGSADLTRRLPEPSQRDELGRLARTFNEMLGQLDEAVGTQRRFLADASHELRTPIAAIRTNVQALLRGAGADPAERELALRSVAREADRMSRLLADLLALARADAGQPLAHERLALDAILLDIYQQQRPQAGEVRLQIGELEQVEVRGDPDRLKQLALNLVDNALRYTPPGGTVTLDVVRRGDKALFRVRDTGLGISTEHLTRIFDRFYRVDHTRARVGGGTGLGLAISRWIAEAHGGRIAVESTPGVGSTFTVALPALLRDVTVVSYSLDAARESAIPHTR
jgi:two-component system, OmpR family, sensor kinase